MCLTISPVCLCLAAEPSVLGSGWKCGGAAAVLTRDSALTVWGLSLPVDTAGLLRWQLNAPSSHPQRRGWRCIRFRLQNKSHFKARWSPLPHQRVPCFLLRFVFQLETPQNKSGVSPRHRNKKTSHVLIENQSVVVVFFKLKPVDKKDDKPWVRHVYEECISIIKVHSGNIYICWM